MFDLTRKRIYHQLIPNYKILYDVASDQNFVLNEIKKLVTDTNVISPLQIKRIPRDVIDIRKLEKQEVITLKYYQYLLNSTMTVKFPQRSLIINELLNIIPYINKYNSFTIYKFDFEKFFYNVEQKKAIETLKKNNYLIENELDFLFTYLTKDESLYPGIGLNNTLIEILGREFDTKIRKDLRKLGLIYYSRYVDDCLIILDERISIKELNQILFDNIEEVFGKKLRLNVSKTKVFYKADLETSLKLEYLGYCFNINNGNFKIGIAHSKITRIISKLERVIKDYQTDGNEEIMCLKLEILFTRIVHFQKGDWKVYGISNTYKEIKRFMYGDSSKYDIDEDTLSLFDESIRRIFDINRIPMPIRLDNQIKNKKFLMNYKSNKTLLLNKQIGLSYKNLKKKVEILEGNKKNLSHIGYEELVVKLMRSIIK